VLTNPLHHTAALSAVVTDTLGAVRDSLLLYDDGLHDDGSAGDSLWGGHIHAPADERLFKVTIRTDDITQGTFHKIPIPMYFATAGPVTLDNIEITKFGSKYKLKPCLWNNGTAFTICGAEVALICKDPWINTITPLQYSIPDLAPGENVTTLAFNVTPNSATFPGYFNIKVDISYNGTVCWTDSMQVHVQGTRLVDVNEELPVACALEQNYPNPFNPSTTITYELPHTAHVTLRIYNASGQEVATLVDQNKPAGIHTVQFNGSHLASGIYLYRLQVGNFTQTSKLMILK
jgi:hypothetical protein